MNTALIELSIATASLASAAKLIYSQGRKKKIKAKKRLESAENQCLWTTSIYGSILNQTNLSPYKAELWQVGTENLCL